MTIEGSADKRSIARTYDISLHEEFLPMQLVFGSKTTQSLSRCEFPNGFCLSANPKHFSNMDESLKVLEGNRQTVCEETKPAPKTLYRTESSSYHRLFLVK